MRARLSVHFNQEEEEDEKYVVETRLLANCVMAGSALAPKKDLTKCLNLAQAPMLNLKKNCFKAPNL